MENVEIQRTIHEFRERITIFIRVDPVGFNFK